MADSRSQRGVIEREQKWLLNPIQIQIFQNLTPGIIDGGLYLINDPNTGPKAVRAINEYNEISDYLDSAKDDFNAVIGTAKAFFS